jgi:hypothetical protein
MTGSLKDTGCKPQSHGSSAPGGGVCPRCGRPRCTAAAKTRPGERCRKNPHPGASICTNHGLTQAGRAAAAERQAEAEAGRVLKKLLSDVQVEPVTDPIPALQRLAGRLQHVTEQIGQMLDEGDLDGPRERAWIRAVRELRQALDGMARLGIEEREIRLREGQAQFVVSAVMPVLELVPRELRDQALVLLLDGLGVEHELVVPGEVVA